MNGRRWSGPAACRRMRPLMGHRLVRAAPLLLLLAACSSPRQGHRPAVEYPGDLLLPSKLGDDFMLRQRIEAEYGEREIGFEAVLQKVGDDLKLLGLTPFGSRAFLLEQKGTAVSFESYVDKPLPFPPRYILLDIQRTLQLDEVRADGTHEIPSEDEVVVETWKDGRLRERRVRRRSGEPEGELVVTYEGGMAPGDPAKVTRFENGWFGYRLRIETIQSQKL